MPPNELEKTTLGPGVRRDKSYLFYGPPGSGKTWAAFKSPATKRLWLDIDNKLSEDSFLDLSKTRIWALDEPLANPDRLEIARSPDPRNPRKGQLISKQPLGYSRTVDIVNELIGVVGRGGGSSPEFPYDLIVLDSLTRLSEHLTRLVMYHHNVDFMTERLWGIALQNLKDFLGAFLNLPCTRIVISHERYQYSDTGSLIQILPSVTGQLAGSLGGSFSEQYYFMGRSPDGKYRIRTAKAALTQGRTTQGLDFECEVTDALFKG